MKNFVNSGAMLAIVAGAAIASGDVVVAGTAVGVASGDIANGDTGNIQLTGVFDLSKVGSQAWTVGAAVYWDESAAECTTTATDNLLIGMAVLAVGSGAGEIVGRVRLNGITV